MILINADSLKWAYKKLKNYVYYSSPASYLKDKIIEFESTYKKDTFENMAQELLSIFSHKHNMVRGQDISYIIFPKKDGVISENNAIIVKDFNVFIDMPLKFFLVDILFTLNIFKSLNYKSSHVAFGNDFDKRLWQMKDGELEGNILENDLLFANFNTQYDLWKEKIYKAIEETDTDKLIVKMDFKRSYYNVYFNINEFIKRNLENGMQRNPIYEFEKQLYRYYSAVLNSIIPSNTPKKNNFVHLPIGLFSSAVIFNILLKDFDESMQKNSIAYSRYVDDILVLLPLGAKNDLDDILKKHFSGIFINRNEDNEYALGHVVDGKGEYVLNKNKIKVLSYKAGFPLGNLKAKLNEIIKPSLDVIEEMDFEDDNVDEYLLLKHDYLKKVIYKIVSSAEEEYDFIKKISDSELINLYSSWKMLLSKEEWHDYFTKRINQAIKQTCLHNEQAKFNTKLREALTAELKYATETLLYEKHLLCDIKQDRTLEHIEKADSDKDDFFYPLITTFDEITLYLSQKKSFFDKSLIAHAEWLYKKLNHFPITKSLDISQEGKNVYYFTSKKLSDGCEGKVRIAVANMNLHYDELVQTDISGEFPHTYTLNEIKNLIDLAKHGGAELILFPEFCLPEQFSFDIVKHCRKRNISIITGLTHRKFSGRLINQILIRDKDLDISFFKWKNYMPIEEKKFCLKNNYGFCVPKIPYYVIVDNGRYKYSTMTCFEATCIKDRALLCDKIEVLFVPVFNRDTFYFSNIISSFVRDASCFVAQSNSNEYGDSRISGPYGQVMLDDVRLKGGVNNYFVIGEIDLHKLRDKNIKGNDLETRMQDAACSCTPVWDAGLSCCLEVYEENDTKPISAGYARYENRQDSGLDKE